MEGSGAVPRLRPGAAGSGDDRHASRGREAVEVRTRRQVRLVGGRFAGPPAAGAGDCRRCQRVAPRSRLGPACYAERLGHAETDHTTRRRPRHPGARGRLRHASRTPAGCASPWRSRTPISSGCPTSGFQTVYRLFNADDDVVCERVVPAAEAGAGRSCARRHAASCRSSRRRRSRDFDVIAFSVSFEWDYTNVSRAAAGRPAAPRRGRDRHASAGRDRRRRDVRQPRAAGAVRRRDRRRRRRSRWCPALVDALCGSRRSRRDAARAAGPRARLLHPVVLRRRIRRPTARIDRDRCREPAPARRRWCSKAAVKTTEPLDPPRTSIFTPDTEFGSRFLIEVVRGCANLCRFCWAGYNYLPVRAVSDRAHPGARARRRAPHSSRAGLVSIALCDHPDIEHILAQPRRTWAIRSARRRCASTT